MHVKIMRYALEAKKESYTTPATETQGSTQSSARRM